jgi:hypothetical protein
MPSVSAINRDITFRSSWTFWRRWHCCYRFDLLWASHCIRHPSLTPHPLGIVYATQKLLFSIAKFNRHMLFLLCIHLTTLTLRTNRSLCEMTLLNNTCHYTNATAHPCQKGSLLCLKISQCNSVLLMFINHFTTCFDHRWPSSGVRCQNCHTAFIHVCSHISWWV